MKTYKLILILSLISIVSMGQPVDNPFLVTDHYTLKTNNIKTPEGSNVESQEYDYSYYNGQVWTDWTNEYAEAYREAFENNQINSNKEVKGDVTKTYNCHSYAWNVCEEGNYIHWINANLNSQNGNDNLARYWDTDGGYIQTTGINYAAKIYYSNGDHSARITSPTTGTVISKWGNKLLVEHPYNDCPYTMTNLEYYKLSTPVISGNLSAICDNSQRTFSESNFSENDIDLDYDWHVGAYLDEISGDGTSSYTVEGTSSIGYSTIYLDVTTPSGATSSTLKHIGVNKPYAGNLSLSLYTSGGTPVAYMCPNTYYHIYINNNDGCSLSNYSWSIPAAWDSVYQYNNMISVYTNSIPGGMVEVYATTCCGVYTKVITDYFGSGYCGQFLMVFSPNPATDETTLSIESTSEEKVLDENEEWELEVYNNTQILKDKKTKIKGNRYKLKTSGWKEGIYFVRVKYKDEILTEKLVIK